MATAITTDLDSQLASLNQLKPPGASKGKIGSITQLCVSNIQVESSIVQSLYRALKKAPATHKLGAIYVIDSVVRQWIEQAKKNGQDLNVEGRGEPGTYPAAVKRVTELMPALFDDTLKGIPQEQRPKLENILAIWEKGNTFPAKMLADFKTKMSGSAAHTVTAPTNGTYAAAPKVPAEKFHAPVPTRPTHTPLGYPPQRLFDQGFIVSRDGETRVNGRAAVPDQPASTSRVSPSARQPPQAAASAPASDVNSILAALASAVPHPMAPTPAQPAQQAAHQPAPPANAALLPPLPPNFAALLGQAMPPAAVPHSTQPLPGPPALPFLPPSSAPSQMPSFQPAPGFPIFPPPPPPPVVSQPYLPQQPAPAPADLLAPLRGILPPNIVNDQGKLLQALTLLQDLQKQGVPMDQWGPVLKAFDDASPPTQAPSNGYGDYDDHGRRRSRSPERSSGRRRASPVYGTYEEIAARKQAETDRNNRSQGGRGRYRQRSPLPPARDPPMRDSPAPRAMNGMPMQPKLIAIDDQLPPGHIKVLSRTLFVGGANGTQQEIQGLFERFGRVQTCIAQRDKRHAFVKMTTRRDALAAKAGVEDLQNRNDREVMHIARQTKWGVGFGPRECCDYQRGESIIPIGKLTQADMKWLLEAEYGGTGGKAVEAGMVLEEPDIEIGAGVSSKAMSKRVMPDAGPPSKRQREERQRGGSDRRSRDHESSAYVAGAAYADAHAASAPAVPLESYGYSRPPEPVAVATPPAVPTFGFLLPNAGGAQSTYR